MATRKCVHCNNEIVPEFRPFCSKRCSEVDLNQWLNGNYVIKDVGDSTQSPSSARSTLDGKTDDIL